jgi:Ala-tRNA(Pro) deacylase
MQVQAYLVQNKIPYRAIKHPPTFGALRVAQAVSVSGHRVAKTVVVEVDGRPVLTVVPATRRLDTRAVKEALDADSVALASESRCRSLFPDCEVGAMPPFGSANGMRTVLDSSLAGGEAIVFESNRHDEAIQMALSDYERIEHPLVAAISKPADAALH